MANPIATPTFDALADIHAASAGHATAADFANFATGGVPLFIAEATSVWRRA